MRRTAIRLSLAKFIVARSQPLACGEKTSRRLATTMQIKKHVIPEAFYEAKLLLAYGLHYFTVENSLTNQNRAYVMPWAATATRRLDSASWRPVMPVKARNPGAGGEFALSF